MMSQDNNNLVTPEGMASYPILKEETQCLVMQQGEQAVEHGIGVRSLPKPGPSTSIVPMETVDDKEDDKTQTVADIGANSGGHGGARSQRLAALLSNGPELSLDDQQLFRARENDRKRRKAQMEKSADKLRNLIPGLNGVKERKVSEGILMQKSVEYIEMLEAELKGLRQRGTEAASTSDISSRDNWKEALKMQLVNKTPHKVLNINFKDLQPSIYLNMFKASPILDFIQGSVSKFKNAVLTGSFTTSLDESTVAASGSAAKNTL